MKTELLPKLMDLLLDTVCAVDTEGRFVYVSASCKDLFGYTKEELQGRVLFDLVHPADRTRTRMAATQVSKGQPILHFMNRYIHKKGHIVDVMWSARWSEADQLRLAVARDVTALKRAERMQAALYQISEAGQAAEGLPALCEQIHTIINELVPIRNFSVVLYNGDLNSTSIPYCVGDVSCIAQNTATQKTASAHQPQALIPDSPLARVIELGELVSTILRADLASGHPGPPREWLGVPLTASHEVIGALVVQGGVDSTEFKKEDQELLQFVSSQIAAAIVRTQTETRLRHLAGHDALTDLPNRTLFQDRVEVALSRARRDKEYLMVLYLDLNDFKQINDQFGHEAGDQVLCHVAKRLRGCLRESDTVARMGGDEFTVLLPNIQGPECVEYVINKIQTALNAPFEMLNQPITLSASIGAAIYPDQGRDYAQLLRQADQRMYGNKQQKERGPDVA